jgi:hypothetical protein
MWDEDVLSSTGTVDDTVQPGALPTGGGGAPASTLTFEAGPRQPDGEVTRTVQYRAPGNPRRSRCAALYFGSSRRGR